MDNISKEQRDILFLQDILKRKFKVHYGVTASKVRLDMVTLCAEFDALYKKVGIRTSKEDKWAILDKKGNGTIERYCSTKEYLAYLQANIKSETPSERHNGARYLRNKVNHTFQQMRKILYRINFESKEYSSTAVNDKGNIKWILNQREGAQNSTNTEFGIYEYNQDFDIKPYVDKHYALKNRAILLKKSNSVANLISPSNNRGHKVTDSHAQLMASMSFFQANFFETIYPSLKGLSPTEAQQCLEQYYAAFSANNSKYAREIVYDQNLKNNISEIAELCNTKPACWLQRCIDTLDKVLDEYRGIVSPLIYADSIIFNANFIAKYGLSNSFKQLKKLPESWINAVGRLYLEAIDIANSNQAIDRRIGYMLEYANFLYDNREFHKAGEYYWWVLTLSERVRDDNTMSSKKAYADALYSMALYYEEFNELSKAQQGYESALNERRELCKRDNRYRSDVAKTLNNLGNLYKTLFDYERAKSSLNESLTIYKQLAKEDAKFKIHRAVSQRNLALVYELLADDYMSLKHIKHALKTIQELAIEDPEEYKCDLAYILLDYAVICSKKENYVETWAKYSEALQIFKELAQLNPHKYRSRLAWTLNKYVIFHKMDNQYATTAHDYFSNALEIYEKLAQNSSKAYDSSVSRAQNLLADIYYRFNDYDKAEELEKMALKIYDNLAQENPNKYDNNCAWTLNALAMIHIEKGEYEQASEENRKATNIYEKLAKNRPEAHGEALSWSQSIAHVVADKDGKNDIASLHKQAIEIYISDLLRRTRRHLM